MELARPVHGWAAVADNTPLGEAILARRLDDGLAPADRLAILNRRVFFRPDEKGSPGRSLG